MQIYQYILILKSECGIHPFPDEALVSRLKLAWKQTVVDKHPNVVSKFHQDVFLSLNKLKD
jgi:hypothetical protein